jgi:dTDP-4-amino-4,6-dideoxygalactose transaminase
MPTPGFNYRASEINCALGLSQLKKLDSFLARRKVIADRYDKALAPLAPLLHPVPRVAGCEGGWHLYPILVDFTSANFSRGDLMRELSKRGIGTQVHYQPVHRQPFWRARQPEINLPGADAYYARCLSLPFFPTMTNEDVDRVVDTLKSILR